MFIHAWEVLEIDAPVLALCALVLREYSYFEEVVDLGGPGGVAGGLDEGLNFILLFLRLHLFLQLFNQPLFVL